MKREGSTHDAHAVDIVKPSSGFSFPSDKLVQSFAAAFLHSFKAELDVDGQGFLIVHMVLKDVEPTQDRPLVVC